MAKYNQKYDWDSIRTEYVVGYFITDPETLQKRHFYPTYKDLVVKYGMNLDWLQKKAQKESWTTRREALQAKLREKTAANTLHSFISDSAQFDAMTIVALKKLYKLVDAYFDQYDFLETNNDGTVSIKDLSDEEKAMMPHIRVNDLKGLVDTLDRAQMLVRRTVGEPIHGAQGENSIVASEIFNPFVEVQSSDERKGQKARVDKLIEKRSSTTKSVEDLKAELRSTYTELGVLGDVAK
jgi:hypothetical protein